MSRRRIIASGDSPAILLPQEVLDEMGLGIGDEVDLTIVERDLVLRRVDEAERGRRIQESTDAVLERRKSAYERLAEGAE